MRRQEVTFRITKINKRAVAVVVCALTGITLPIASSAGNLGSSFPPGSSITPTKTGDVFYTNTITSAACNGSAVAPAAFTVTPPATAAIYTCPVGGTVANTYILNNFETRLNQFGQVISAVNHNFGQGAQIDALILGTAGLLTGTGVVGSPFVLQLGTASAVAEDGRAIDLGSATAQFYGGNRITGSTRAGTINILGANVEFNGTVTGKVNISANGALFRNTVTGNVDVLGGYSSQFDTNSNLVGNLNFLASAGQFTFSGGNTVTGNIFSLGGTATLNFAGNATVTGGVGAVATPNAPISNANVNGGGSFVRFNTVSGNTVIEELNINASQSVVQFNGLLVGNVYMNGKSSRIDLLNRDSTATVPGMLGTLDFGTFGDGAGNTQGYGSLKIGNNVNLILGDEPTTGLSISKANNSTLVFSGTSTIYTALGSARTSNDTFNRIWAGAESSSVVTFTNDVYVFSPSIAASYVGELRTGGGTINLNGNLYGNLVIGSNGIAPRAVNNNLLTSYGDTATLGTFGDGGTVNIAHNASSPLSVLGSIQTNTTGTGKLNFVGSSNYLGGTIGESGKKLELVAFNSSTSTATSTIRNHVYSNLTSIGNASNSTVATLIRTGEVGDSIPLYLGDSLTLVNNKTTLNTDSIFGTAGLPPSELTYDKDNISGRLSNSNTIRALVGSGVFTTNGATLNFSVDSGSLTSKDGLIIESTSSRISATTVNLLGSEKFNIAYLGSAKNNVSYKLINGNTGFSDLSVITTDTDVSPRVFDNSFVLNTTLRHGSVELLVQRDNDEYIEKSNTQGEISNPAALRLGTLGAAGAGYTSDMQVVFNKLDIDQWGYGNNEANLATQVRRLIPIVNGSDIHSALSVTSAAMSAASGRLSVLRGDSNMSGLDGNGQSLGFDETAWAKVLGGVGTGDSIDGYDGFESSFGGLSLGMDTLIENGVLGIMGHVSNSDIRQKDFRSGDTADMLSAGLGMYITQEFGPLYFEGLVAHTVHELESERATVVGRTAKADVKYNQTSARLAAGYRFELDSDTQSVITPILAVEHSNIKHNAYTETGAGDIGLEVDGRTLNITRGSFGLRFTSEFATDNGVFYPDLYIGYNSTSGLNKTSMVANYIGDTTLEPNFDIVGVTPKKTSYTVSAGLRYAISANSEIQLGYKFEGDQNLSSHQASIRASWAF